MKAVIQRVSHASVVVEGRQVGNIQRGILILLGIANDDVAYDLKRLIKKIVNLRIFDDQKGLMDLSIKDIDGDVLIISQFTLYAEMKKGNRPSYIKAARSDLAIPLYENFIMEMERELGKSVQMGIFGADMKVTLLNDGPVTIIVDTKEW